MSKGRHILPALVFVLAFTAAALHIRVKWQVAPDAVTALQNGQYELAYRYLTSGKDRHSPDAQLNLGNLYYAGLGRPVNYPEALHWYRLSAIGSNVSAQYNMGIMHQQGLGTTADGVTAAAWFQLANNNGDPLAKVHLRTISGSLNPNKLQEATRLHDQLMLEIQRADSGRSPPAH